MTYPATTPRGTLFQRSDPPSSPQEAARRGWGVQDIYVHFDLTEKAAREVVWAVERERLRRKT